MVTEKAVSMSISLRQSEIKKYDELRLELGMSRSEYLRYLMSGKKKILNPSISYKEMINKLSEIDLSLRTIVLRQDLSEEDVLKIYAEIDEIKDLIKKNLTSGP